MNARDRIFIQHMRDHALEVLQFIHERERADLDKDRLLLRGLSMSIGIIGEAARAVSDETREKYPDIPWADMIGTRNFLFHAYFKVDYDILWNTTQLDIPLLLQKLEALLA